MASKSGGGETGEGETETVVHTREQCLSKKFDKHDFVKYTNARSRAAYYFSVGARYSPKITQNSPAEPPPQRPRGKI